jgi:methylated-DNA-[protein]-cysteine S-methyltransferase
MICSIIGSPIGDLLVTGNGVAITGLYTPGHGRRPEPDWVRDDAAFADLRRQLAEYFAGDREDFELPLAPVGTPFQQSVWAALQRIDYATTATYGQLAVGLGLPTAMRAVGAANGRNPISIVVPCHRVIGANGSLTGYAGGLAAKRWLLDHEQSHAGAKSYQPTLLGQVL